MSGKIVEYYYVQDQYMISVHISKEENGEQKQSVAETYSEAFHMLWLGAFEELSFTENTFMEALS